MSGYQKIEETDWTPVVRAVLEACGPDMSSRDITSFLLLLLRKRAGLSQMQMSSYLRVSCYTYRQLERGKTVVDATFLANLALGFRIQTKEIYWLLP